jgi:hypothetical protein
MKTYLLIAAAAAILPAVSVAQTTPVGASFHPDQVMIPDNGVVVAAVGGRGGRGGVVTGKPYSATAVTHTVQMLADGSQIENTRSEVLYRDDQGRTRTETNDGKNIQILDRVAGVNYNINTVTKTAREVDIVPARGVNITTPAATATGTASPAAIQAMREAVIQVDVAREGTAASQPGRKPDPATEDLGVQSFYGVQAHGVRSTNTIPVGAIGNNRELKVVNESWRSEDLGLVVKTINSDPRFGTTTYELTNLSTSSPDPSLFRVPAGYTVSQLPARN